VGLGRGIAEEVRPMKVKTVAHVFTSVLVFKHA
jgi:hypothetical protein